MLETTIDEVDGAFAAAKNLNAALKNFLKKAVRSDESAGRFAKDFRTAVSSCRPAVIRSFIERHYKDHEGYFLQVAHFAHSAFINSYVEQTINTYGDRFNATYVSKEQGIEVKDQGQFSSIVKEVAAKSEVALKEAGLPVNNFMKNSLLVCVFEENVLREVLPILTNRA